LRYGRIRISKAALYRNPATADEAWRRAATPGQGAFLQQPGGFRGCLAFGAGIFRTDHGDHQTHKSLWSGQWGDLGGKLPARAGRRPVSAYGSVIAFNRAVDGPTAEELSSYLWKPSWRPVLRLLRSSAWLVKKKPSSARYVSNGWRRNWTSSLKAVGGGLLVPNSDSLPAATGSLKCVTERKPSRKSWRH